MKRKILKLSIICLIIAVGIFVIDYMCFHYLTDSGFTNTKLKEAGKPFVVNLIGQLGVFFLFSSIISFISALVFFDKDNKQN